MKEDQKITVGNIRVTYRPDSDPDAAAIHKAASLLNRKTGSAPRNLQISKKSIDARRRAELSFVYTQQSFLLFAYSLRIPVLSRLTLRAHG